MFQYSVQNARKQNKKKHQLRRFDFL